MANRWRSRLRPIATQFAIAVVALALGVGAVYAPRLLRALRDQSTTSRNARAELARLAHDGMARGRAPVDVTPPPDAPDLPAAASPTPQDAVAGFLNAESAGDFATSYGFLAGPDRQSTRSRDRWVDKHAELPPITSFIVEGVTLGEGRAEVTTRTDLRAGLDEFVGLVPAHARGTWVALTEDGGWRVSYAASRLDPEFPAESAATDAARAWVAARQSCRRGEEYRGGLIGAPRLAGELCHKRGAVRVGSVMGLGEIAESEPFLAAFGPDATSWARVVPVEAPARLGVVLAPVGERWLVIGAVKSSSGGR